MYLSRKKEINALSALAIMLVCATSVGLNMIIAGFNPWALLLAAGASLVISIPVSLSFRNKAIYEYYEKTFKRKSFWIATGLITALCTSLGFSVAFSIPHMLVIPLWSALSISAAIGVLISSSYGVFYTLGTALSIKH